MGHIAPRVVLFDATVQDWLKHTPDARAVSLSEWQALSLPEPLIRQPVPVNRDDTAVMIFTSGTTGEPKGAIITHNNLLCAIDAYTQKLNLTAADSTILAVPVYHITGLSALLALFISLGASIWLQHRFNAPQVINTLREKNITFLPGSPTIFILLCQAAREQSASHPLSHGHHSLFAKSGAVVLRVAEYLSFLNPGLSFLNHWRVTSITNVLMPVESSTTFVTGTEKP